MTHIGKYIFAGSTLLILVLLSKGVLAQAATGPAEVALSLSKLPPTRTWCVVETTEGPHTGEYVTFEWDPLSPGPLKRRARLPGTHFQVSCSAEPARHAIESNCDYAWHPDNSTVVEKGGAKVEVKFIERCPPSERTSPAAQETLKAPPPAPDVKATLDITATEVCQERVRSLHHKDLVQIGDIPGTARSFGGTDAAAAEIFRALAEVVIERVTNEALRVVKNNLIAELAGRDEILLRTLAAFERLNLADLEHTADDIRQAIQLDLLAYALRTGGETSKTLQRPAATLTQAARSVTLDGSETFQAFGMAVVVGRASSTSAGLLIVNVLESMAKGKCECTDDGCPPAVVIAELLIEAANTGRLDNGYLRRAADNPKAYLGIGPRVDPERFELLATGANLLRTKSFSPREDMVRALEFVAESQGLKEEKGTAKWSPGERARVIRAALGGELEVAVSLVAAKEISGNSGLAKGESRAFRSLALIAAVVDTTPLGPDATDDQRQQSLEKRKRAVERLIDSNVPRGSRTGGILSVGSLLNVNVAWGPSTRVQPLGINLGVAWDYHWDGLGFHANVSPFDIGAYASFEDGRFDETPSWSAALSPSLSLGITLVQDESSIVWFFGGMAAFRATPSEEEGPSERDLYTGLALGAYVPFFDFN